MSIRKLASQVKADAKIKLVISRFDPDEALPYPDGWILGVEENGTGEAALLFSGW
jgi:hypothetical protein